MSNRQVLERQLREAKVGLWEGFGGCVVVPLVSALFVPAFAAIMPIAAIIAVINYRRYVRTKRELAELEQPPTARLLR